MGTTLDGIAVIPHGHRGALATTDRAAQAALELAHLDPDDVGQGPHGSAARRQVLAIGDR